jgi:hypothetical protein
MDAIVKFQEKTRSTAEVLQMSGYANSGANSAHLLGMIFGLPVLLVSILMGVIPAEAASKRQCVRTVCTPGKRGCIGNFTTQFHQAKGDCAAGKAGAQCRKDAKGAFTRNKGLCKTTFVRCKTCCASPNQSDCTTTTTTLAPSTTTSTTTTTTTTTTTPIHVVNLSTITGTFTGHDDDQGSVLDWSGTATFTRADTGTGPGIAGVFALASGEATVTASGTAIGTGCQQTGTQPLALSPSSVWSVEGGATPYTYQIVAPFDYPGTIDVTWVNCSDPNLNGHTSTASIGPAAILSGDIGGLSQTSPDGFAYDGGFSGAGSDPGEMVKWTWSMKASP